MVANSRRVLPTLLFFILSFTWAIHGQGFINTNRLIRVGLESIGRQKTFNIIPSNGFIEIFDNRIKHALYSGKAAYVKVSYAKKGAMNIEIDGKKNFLNLKSEILFSPVGKPPNYIKLQPASGRTRSYRGSIAVEVTKNRLFAINQTDIEDYLKSVVPSEIFNRAPAAAMEAQAIAARTYAIRNFERHRKKSNYDVCDTVHCQVYTGMAREIKAASTAVMNTEGKILVFENEPANTVYHSNCGGILISSVAAWGGKKIPYLVSHRDGIKGQSLFCELGLKFKKSKTDIELPKPVKRLIVHSYPDKTKKKLRQNFGHRVGMCQDGAIGMAAIGYSYRQILGFYYPGTALATLNYARKKHPALSKPSRKIVKQEKIILAMKPPAKPEPEIKAISQEHNFPLNPTQLDVIKNLRNRKGTKSVLGALKEISGQKSKYKTDFKKIFWNPVQPDISKESSAN
ncbi:MAG: hypothetical protein Kow0029_18530 [Candidatus Rifleibacteriota bacterium]